MLSKVFSLDEFWSPQIWNIEQEKDREKEKFKRRSEVQRERGRQSLERGTKNKGDFFCWKNNMKIL